MIVQNPLNTTFKRWARRLRSLPNIQVPIVDKTKPWQIFANQLKNLNPNLNLPSVNILQYPNEEDWKKWAVRVLNELSFL